MIEIDYENQNAQFSQTNNIDALNITPMTKKKIKIKLVPVSRQVSARVCSILEGQSHMLVGQICQAHS